MEEILESRGICYKCDRPKTSCMCKYTKALDTNTKFIILMHPKEHRKTKNGTGRFTHLNLKNSEIFIGIDFTNNKKINELIQSHNCFILYPGEKSINLNKEPLSDGYNKKNLIFIIDSTWACSKKMIRESTNIKDLPKVSFEYEKPSNFKIKTQPSSYCLSTIESTLCVLKHLNKHNLEEIKKDEFEYFLEPFNQMIKYQLSCLNETTTEKIRYKKPYKKEVIF